MASRGPTPTSPLSGSATPPSARDPPDASRSTRLDIYSIVAQIQGNVARASAAPPPDVAAAAAANTWARGGTGGGTGGGGGAGARRTLGAAMRAGAAAARSRPTSPGGDV